MADAFHNGIPLKNRVEKNITRRKSCWIWENAVSPNGYTWANNELAHRAVYKALVGPIKKGLVIDHTCSVRNCVNPAHLEAVTQKENVYRAKTSIGSVNHFKTHCKNGHQFTRKNIYRPPKRPGRRYCKACQDIRNRKVRIS